MPPARPSACCHRVGTTAGHRCCCTKQHQVPWQEPARVVRKVHSPLAVLPLTPGGVSVTSKSTKLGGSTLITCRPTEAAQHCLENQEATLATHVQVVSQTAVLAHVSQPTFNAGPKQHYQPLQGGTAHGLSVCDCVGQRTAGHDWLHARLPDGAPRLCCVPFKGLDTPWTGQCHGE